MNLRTQISERLWEAIASAYDAGNYAHAILESIHVITTVLREKSGLDGDGNQLVGKALGGDDPKIRLNSLQTDTEKNIQKGFESILRGIYSAIRNPRSHEAAAIDDRRHADAIICFVDYLLAVLDASKEAFSTESFLGRVRDADFVDSPRYSELLVSDIPTGRLGDALIAVYRERRHLPLQKRATLIRALLKTASEPQLASFLSVVSEEFLSTNEIADVRTSLQFLVPELWPRLHEAARLRIENKLITGMRNGKVLADGSTTEALSTWAHDFLKAFTLRAEAASTLFVKLMSDEPESTQYVARYFFGVLPDVATADEESARVLRAIARAVRTGDKHVRDALIRNIDDFPESWQKKLVELLAAQTDKENPARILNDGTPFLTAEKDSEFDDDIPF